VSPLRSNWSATVNGAMWGSDVEDEDDANEPVSRRPARKAPRPELVTLDVAAAALGMQPGVGRAWRRQVRTRLRALERERGVSLCVARRGRGGLLVRLDALRRVNPVWFAGIDRVAELSAKVSELEERVAAAERITAHSTRLRR
jgi:hypothetical protein